MPPLLPHIKVITEQQAEHPLLYSRVPLAIHFTHGRVDEVNPTSRHSSHPPFPTTPWQVSSTSVSYICVPLFLPWKRSLCHFLDSTHALIHDICFSFWLDFILCGSLKVHPHFYKWPNLIPFKGWAILHHVCVHHVFLIHSAVDGHLGLSCPGYYRQYLWTLGCMCPSQLWFPWGLHSSGISGS